MLGRHSPVPIFARVLLLAVAAGVALFAWKGPAESPLVAAHPRYSCPMHPEVTSARPGPCPLCGMELVLTQSPGAAVPGTGLERLRPRTLQHQPRAWASIEPDGRITAILYLDDLALVPPGAQGRLHALSLAAGGVPVERTERAPVPHDGATAEVEFRATGPRGELVPGGVGQVELPPRSGPALVVPTTAVLASPDSPFVLVEDPESRRLVRRPVTVGRATFGMTVLVSGVTPSDRVAVRGAFFLDAEQTLGDRGGQ